MRKVQIRVLFQVVISLPGVWAGLVVGRQEWLPVAVVEDRVDTRNVVVEEPRNVVVDVAVAVGDGHLNRGADDVPHGASADLWGCVVVGSL